MPVVCGKLTSDFVFDCENRSTGGVGQVIKLYNRSDIDYAVSVPSITESSHKITDIAVKSLAPVIEIQSLPNKRLISATFTPSDSDYGVFWNHQIRFPALGLSEEVLISLRELAAGAEMVAIVEDNFKGAAGADTFKIYGWDNGLKMIEGPYDSNANNGNIPIVLGSMEPNLERYPPLIWLDTDAATTKAAFDAL